jgi:membrane-associated protein
VDAVTGLLGEVPAWLACLVAGLVVVGEPALLLGVVLPSLTSMLVLGFLARGGVLPLAVAAGTAVLSAALGDSLGYLSGHRWGRRRELLVRRVGAHRWAAAERLFQRFGTPSVFGARWVAGPRTLVPRLAALTAMPYRRFLLYSIPSAILWGGTVTGAGYLAGREYPVIARTLGGAGLAVVAALLLAAIIAWSVHRRRLGSGWGLVERGEVDEAGGGCDRQLHRQVG